MSRSKSSMDPQTQAAMNKFKIECAEEIGYQQYVKENNDHYKGDLSCKQNGSEGGPIGGQMVKKMIQMAKTQL